MTVNAHNWLCGHRNGHFLWDSDTLTNNDLNILGVPADAQLAILDLHYCFCNKKPNTYSSHKYMHWPKLDVLQVDTFVKFYGAPVPPASKWVTPRPPPEPPPTTPQPHVDIACSLWDTTAQQSSQHVQVSISTPTTSSGVPCVPLPTNLSSHTKEVPSTSSHTHHHQVPPGSLCYNKDPIPSQHLSNFVSQVEIPAQCTQTTMYGSSPDSDSVATTVAAYHLHTVVRVKGLIHMTGLPEKICHSYCSACR
jgi:hypothetical protein